jgi:signal transduction histidine kinase
MHGGCFAHGRRSGVGFGRLGLRCQLVLLASVVVLLTGAGSVLAMLHLERETLRADQSKITASEGLFRARSFRLAISELERKAEQEQDFHEELTDVRVHFAALVGPESTESDRSAHRKLGNELNALAAVLNAGHSSWGRAELQRHDAYIAVDRSLKLWTDLRQQEVDWVSGLVKSELHHAGRQTVAVLGLYILFLLGISAQLISMAVQPIQVLSQAMEALEFDQPAHEKFKPLPRLKWKAPEVARLSAAFDHMLTRLHGFRDLNLHRLLMEKRSRDVILAAVTDGIFLFHDEEIVYLSPVAERILRLPTHIQREGLNVFRATSWIQDSASKATLQALQKAIHSNMPVNLESEIDSEHRASYLLQAYAIPPEMVSRVENEMSRSAQEMELKPWKANWVVVARDLTLIKESQEAKVSFLATLSHEIKTPVTSLTMATRLLKKSVEQFEKPTHRMLIQTCADDVDRLRTLLDELLSASTFDTLAQKPVLKDVNLAKLVRQVVQHFQPDAFSRGLTLGMAQCLAESPGGGVTARVDPTQVSWALTNILTNALRHTPRGGEISASVSAHAGKVEISVRDSGVGIDKRRLERIFDKYNPQYDLRVARSGSVGMGLAIAREIVLAHGGRIWAESEVGKGSRFSFEIPALEMGEQHGAHSRSG